MIEDKVGKKSYLGIVINYDKETITVDVKSGTIVSEGTISIVGLPDEYNQ